MKKIITGAFIIALCISLLACNNDKDKSGNGKETAASIAQKWCDLNAKVHTAKTDEEKEKAKAARKDYENTIDTKYKGDEALSKEIEKEVEKCEDASEGR